MLDLLYERVAAARRRWYERRPHRRRRLAQPVISIGNLSVGGTGKTPLVAALATWLAESGERPAILSRGYGRRDRRDAAVVVADGRKVCADVQSAGDEPLMLARRVPAAIVVVGDDRHVCGALAERQLGATVHVLDDGFQHLALARDLDVLVTAPGEITSGRVLPFGRLREGKDAAARAHAVVVVGTDVAGARREAWALGVSQAFAARRVLKAAPDAEPVFAVAGIARPGQFFAALEASGWDVRGTAGFADHHWFSAAEIAQIATRARAAGAAVVVTTEKDMARLTAAGPLPFTCRAVPMRLDVDDWDLFCALVTDALERRRAA